jgi:hypothetical protein
MVALLALGAGLLLAIRLPSRTEVVAQRARA